MGFEEMNSSTTTQEGIAIRPAPHSVLTIVHTACLACCYWTPTFSAGRLGKSEQGLRPCLHIRRGDGRQRGESTHCAPGSLPREWFKSVSARAAGMCGRVREVSERAAS